MQIFKRFACSSSDQTRGSESHVSTAEYTYGCSAQKETWTDFEILYWKSETG